MKERDIQNIFGKRNKIFGAFELKLAKGNSIPFNSVKKHQIEGLVSIQSDGLYYKINDSPWTQEFTNKKPFDCFNLRGIPAYVVICWYVPRKKKIFHYIPVNDFIYEMQNSKRKSLTIDRSELISRTILWKI
jgi:penicillin-binding protein-related factor A (putative recombinase)